MHIAHVILAHQRPPQLARLAARLAHPDDSVHVHVDARQPLEPFRAALEPVAGAALVERVASPWGSWGLVAASLVGLRAALAAGAEVVCLLSGADYPIKPRAQMAARLSGGQVFLEAFPLPAPGFVDGGGMDRLERWYLKPSRRWSLPNRYVPFWPRRRLPAGLAPYAGKQFWCLPRPVAEDVVATVDRRPELVRFFRRSFVADESFIQMLVMNGPYADAVVNDDLRFIRHAPGEAHPRLLTAADLPAMAAADDLFARKFDDDALLDRIDTDLLGR